MRLVSLLPSLFPTVLRALPLTAALFAIAADSGPCSIIVNNDDDDDDDDDEDCADLGDICPSLSCENGNVLDSDGCPICECNTTACDVDAAGPAPECANARFDEQTCSWTCGSTEECFSDSDCGRGFICALTDCADSPDGGGADCGNGGGICIQVTQGCVSDADCGPGFICDFSGGAVPPGDGNGAEEPCFDDNGDGICDGADDDQADPAPPPPEGQCVFVEQECRSDADCDAGFVCQLNSDDANVVGDAGVCVFAPPVSCSADEECAPGQHCEFTDAAGGIVALPGGICVDNPAVQCFADGDCARDEFCDFSQSGGGAERPCNDDNNDGICDGDADIAPPPPESGVCAPRPAPTCTSDAECADGEFCSFEANGDARPAPPCDPTTDVSCEPVPPLEGVCKPLVVEQGCSTNDDCTNGQVCVVADDCACDAVCIDDGNGGCLPCVCGGSCVDVECTSDADCNADEFCAQADANIAPPPDCDPASGAECPLPASGVCRDLERDPCAAICGEGVACAIDADGNVACAEPAQTCSQDSDCADGTLCSLENCIPDDTGACLGTCFDPRDAP